MASPQYELEVYFAKKHKNLYVEFGGHYYNYEHPILPTAMQQYFNSGKYNELNDPELERLWKKVKKRRKIAFLVLAGFIMMIFIITVASK